MEWWEETAQALIALHPLDEQKQFGAAIRDGVRLAVERARREGYELGLAEGWSTEGDLLSPALNAGQIGRGASARPRSST